MYCRYNFRTFWIFLTLIDLENKGTCVVVYRVRLEAKDFDMVSDGRFYSLYIYDVSGR